MYYNNKRWQWVSPSLIQVQGLLTDRRPPSVHHHPHHQSLETGWRAHSIWSRRARPSLALSEWPFLLAGQTQDVYFLLRTWPLLLSDLNPQGSCSPLDSGVSRPCWTWGVCQIPRPEPLCLVLHIRAYGKDPWTRQIIECADFNYLVRNHQTHVPVGI